MPVKPKTFVACWAQPPENFQIWKDDGVNVIIGPDAGNPPRFTQLALHEKVKALDLWYIDVPKSAGDLERMVLDPSCLAIGLPDEMDLRMPAYNAQPVEFAAAVKAKISEVQWIVTQTAGRKRLCTNFAGPKVLGGTAEPVRPYAGQMQQPFVELIKSIPRKPGVEKHILSADFYPSNQNRARYLDTYPGECIKFMKQWWGESEFTYWSYLECSDQVLDKTEVIGDVKNIGRAPTPAELEAQFNHVMDQGVTGIEWFSHKFNIGWNNAELVDGWDGRSPELRIKCREIAKWLNAADVEPQPSPLEGRVSSLEAGLKEVRSMIDSSKLLLDQVDFRSQQTSQAFETLKLKAITNVTLIRE